MCVVHGRVAHAAHTPRQSYFRSASPGHISNYYLFLYPPLRLGGGASTRPCAVFYFLDSGGGYATESITAVWHQGIMKRIHKLGRVLKTEL